MLVVVKSSHRENGLFDKKSVRDYSHCLKFERKGGNELQDKCKMNIANYAKQRNNESEKLSNFTRHLN